jgi:TIR domain
VRIFISWSGPLSHKVALALRDWLPLVIQSLEPYVSSEDIEKGTRWSVEMAQEVETSRYGIICVTRENVRRPWINFEAGALSRSIEKTAVRPFSTAVSPFLFDLQSAELEGPLTQFQYVKNEREEISKLVSSINSKLEPAPLAVDKVERAFRKWWPELENALATIAVEGVANKIPDAGKKTEKEILTDLLDLVRAQQRLMVSKDEIVKLFGPIQAAIEQITQPSAFNLHLRPSIFGSLKDMNPLQDVPSVFFGTTVKPGNSGSLLTNTTPVRTVDIAAEDKPESTDADTPTREQK